MGGIPTAMSLNLRCPLCGKVGIPSEYVYWLHVYRKHMRLWKQLRQEGMVPYPSRRTCAHCGKRINLGTGMWVLSRLQYFHAKCWFKQALERQLAK